LAVNHHRAANTAIWTKRVALMFTTGFLSDDPRRASCEGRCGGC
jgi:hypothetical protein